MRLLEQYNDLFPDDPEKVPPCTLGKLCLPLIDEGCHPVAAKQRRYSPVETEMIQSEVNLLASRGIIRKSSSAWAAPCVVVPKKDGTLRLCQDYRALNTLLLTDSSGLGDIRGIYDRLHGQKYFTSECFYDSTPQKPANFFNGAELV